MNKLIAAGGTITNPVLPSKLGDSPDSVGYLQKMIPTVVTLLLIGGSLFFFFNLIMGAIQWISSGGDKEGLSKAKGRITSALVGLVILFAVFAIIQLIENFFGVNILILDIGKVFI